MSNWPEFLQKDVFVCEGGIGMPHEQPKSYLGVDHCPQCFGKVQKGGKKFSEDPPPKGDTTIIFGNGRRLD